MHALISGIPSIDGTTDMDVIHNSEHKSSVCIVYCLPVI